MADAQNAKEGRQAFSPSGFIIISLSIYEHPLGVSTIFDNQKSGV
jgi:hypothetical protein